jgi:predicted transcriptional regulator
LFILFGIWSVIGGSLIGGAWMALIGWFLANAARSGYEQMMLKNALSGVEVDRIMTPEVPSVSPDLTIEQLVDDYMMKQENSVFPVVQDDNFLGVVSLEDIQQIPRETWSQVHVRAITHPAENERLVQSGEDAWDAFRHTANSGIQRLLVLRDNKIAGMISRDNLLNLARARLQLNMNKA